MNLDKFFTAKRALSDYRANRKTWSGGAIIVRARHGFQAIPGAYLADISYTGSREAVNLDEVRAAAKMEK